MVIPQISLPIAFAIGLPIGVAGYFGQWALLRRRRRRQTEAAGGWGPTQNAQGQPSAAVGASGEGIAAAGAAATAPEPAPAAQRASRRAAAGAEPLAPVNRKALADRRQLSAQRTQLRKREAYLERALDALVGFVDGEPRRARARICARDVSRLVPKARRSAELQAFLADVEGKRSPADLQDDAEQAGIQLAVELKAVKTELESLPD